MGKQNAVYTYSEILISHKKACATAWMNLENILLSERKPTQKDK